jgi:hypothetical protein
LIVITAEQQPEQYPTHALAVLHAMQARSDDLYGPARFTVDDHDERGFRFTALPNGEMILTLLPAVGLADVYQWCFDIIQECWDECPELDVTRDQEEANRRITSFGHGD